MIEFNEQSIERLVGLYRKAIEDIAGKFVSTIDFRTPRAYAQLHELLKRLSELDSRTQKWALSVLPRAYRAALKLSVSEIRNLGISRRLIREAHKLTSYQAVNETAIWMLLYDQTAGFIPVLRNALGQIRGRLQTIQKQGKLLLSQRGKLNEIVASDFFLRGKTLNDVRDSLVREIVSHKNLDELIWTPRALGMVPDSIIGNVAMLPYVKVPSSSAAAGFRKLRLDKYAELVARTKIGQAYSAAEMNEMRAHDIDLFMVSRNAPLVDDVCWLFVGKIIATTRAAAKQYGVPHVSELPEGSPPPWHPNCRHSPIPVVLDFMSAEELEAGLGGVPRWALNTQWTSVNKAWRKGGGVEKLGKLNEANIKASQIPRKAVRGKLPSWLSVGEKPGDLPAVEMSKDRYFTKLTETYGIDERAARRIVGRMK